MNRINKFSDLIVSKEKYHFYIFFVILLLVTLMMNSTHYFGIPYSGHDFNYQYLRLDALIRALREGTFPYYIDYTRLNNYGYFVSVFYCDLMLIPFAAIGLIIGTIHTYSLIMIVITLLSGIITYICVNKVFRNTILAFLIGILYTFCYYKLFNNYVRASLAESIAMTFVPLVFWGGYELLVGNYKKWYIFTIAFSLLIFSHNVIPVISLITFVMFALIYYKRLLAEPKRIYWILFSGFYALLITAYFVYPLLEQVGSNKFFFNTPELKLTSTAQGFPLKYIFEGLFVGIGSFIQRGSNYNNLGIGITLTFLNVLRLFIKNKSKLLTVGDQFLIVSIVLLLIISPLYPWHTYPFKALNFMQFSWRFYAIISFTLSISGGLYFYILMGDKKRSFMRGISLVLLVTILLIMSFSESLKFHTSAYSASVPTIKNHFLLFGGDFLPSRVPQKFSIFCTERSPDSIQFNPQKSVINKFYRDKSITNVEVNLYSTEGDTLELPLIYYKGYAMSYADDKVSKPVSQSSTGLIEIPVDRSGKIVVWYEGTMIQKISPFISILSSILLFFYIIFSGRKKKI